MTLWNRLHIILICEMCHAGLKQSVKSFLWILCSCALWEMYIDCEFSRNINTILDSEFFLVNWYNVIHKPCFLFSCYEYKTTLTILLKYGENLRLLFAEFFHSKIILSVQKDKKKSIMRNIFQLNFCKFIEQRISLYLVTWFILMKKNNWAKRLRNVINYVQGTSALL